MTASSTNSFGSGEATTLRHHFPSCRTSHERSVANLAGLILRKGGAHEFGGIRKGRVVRFDHRLAHDARHLSPGKRVLEGLEEPVANHALCLGTENVEGVGAGQRRITGALDCQDANLRSIAVGDDELMVKCQRD